MSREIGIDEFIERLKKEIVEAGEYGATEEFTEVVNAGGYPLKVNILVEPVEVSREGKEFEYDIALRERIILENNAFDWECKVCVDKDTGEGKLRIKTYYEHEDDRGKIRWEDKDELYEIARTLLAALLELGKVSENMRVKDIVGEKGVKQETDVFGGTVSIRGYGYWREVD